MNKEMLLEAVHIKGSYNLNKKKVIKKLLDELFNGTYSCYNEHGEDVLIIRKATFVKKGKVREIKGAGMEIWIFQGNGYLYFQQYNEKGYIKYEEYKGRY